VAKSKKSAENKPGQPNALVRYLRETRGEIRKVTWPTRQESWRLTAIVIAVTILTAAFLWLFDTIFSGSIQFLIEAVAGL
jgi:preprotein translocase subunit SecE